MSFLPVWSFESMNCGLHVYRCLALKLVFAGVSRVAIHLCGNAARGFGRGQHPIPAG
jgi:hypothetical protein